MRIIVDIPDSLYPNLEKIRNGSTAAGRILDSIRKGKKIKVDEIREKLNECVNYDTVDILVDVMRLLEGGKHGETDNDS